MKDPLVLTLNKPQGTEEPSQPANNELAWEEARKAYIKTMDVYLEVKRKLLAHDKRVTEQLLQLTDQDFSANWDNINEQILDLVEAYENFGHHFVAVRTGAKVRVETAPDEEQWRLAALQMCAIKSEMGLLNIQLARWDQRRIRLKNHLYVHLYRPDRPPRTLATLRRLISYAETHGDLTELMDGLKY
jgi:hypothetical protein